MRQGWLSNTNCACRDDCFCSVSPEGTERRPLPQERIIFMKLCHTQKWVKRAQNFQQAWRSKPKQSQIPQGRQNNADQALASVIWGQLLRSGHIRLSIWAARSLTAWSHNLPSSHLQCCKLLWKGDFCIPLLSLALFTNKQLVIVIQLQKASSKSQRIIDFHNHVCAGYIVLKKKNNP